MKKYLFTLILFANFSLFAQTTSIPDPNFEQALIDKGIDSDGVINGQVATSDINTVTSLDVDNSNISDLTGVEGFVGLTYLLCQSNQLTSIDVSSNTSLVGLFCGGNELTSLDMSSNTALTHLFCGGNELTSLDVSANTALSHLGCGGNELTSLDVSANTALTYLWCYENQLTSLDVSANTALTDLRCYENKLTSLDVRNGNNATITTFDATGNANLKCIYVDDKTSSDMDDWEIIAISNYVDNETECNALPDYTDVPDPNFEQALIDLDIDSDGAINGQVANSDISTITSLNVGYSNISDLTGVEGFTALTELLCPSNQLTSIDVSANTVLNTLICSNNQLTSLDVSSNTWLTYLKCHSNQLTSIDVSANTVLTYLTCYENNLTSLDVSSNTWLTNLYCEKNNLTSLDLSSNTVLTSLACFSNNLTSLDLSSNTALLFLDCSLNGLTNLDLPSNSALTRIFCSNNQLTSLDVSENTALTFISCNNNQLTSLDLSSNTALTRITCVNNQLTSLDIRNGNNASLTIFDATDNANLTCIYVDDASAGFLSSWIKDATSSFVNNETECDLHTSLNELSKNDDFILFPNPVKDNFCIQTSENIESVGIYTIYGQLVKEYKYQDTYPVSDLKPGWYLIRIKSNERFYSQQVMVE